MASTTQSEPASDDPAVDRGIEPLPPQTRLYNFPFIALCVVGLLGYGHQFLIQPVLPLLVLDRGGDASQIGIIIAAFSFPSVMVRPVVGRLADSLSSRRVLAAGTAGLGICGFVYVLPSLLVVFANRVVHGLAWASFNTGSNSLLGRIAPTQRRGEAAGVYNLFQGISQTVAPGIGLLLYSAFGLPAPFIASGLLGLGAAAVVLARAVPEGHPHAVARPAAGRDAWLEPGAVLPMMIAFLFYSVFPLFLIYPPVYANARGIPIDQLALFYPVVGISYIGSLAVGGRITDRVSRGLALGGATALAIAAFAIVAVTDSLIGLTIGGMIYAAALGISTPASMALAMDRAEPARLGSAMATFTLGYQLALGIGAAVWGFVISLAGFPAPYVLAILPLVALLGLLFVRRRGFEQGA
jgi:predicted MFS family arabinose efflux permease